MDNQHEIESTHGSRMYVTDAPQHDPRARELRIVFHKPIAELTRTEVADTLYGYYELIKARECACSNHSDTPCPNAPSIGRTGVFYCDPCDQGECPAAQAEAA